MSELARFLRTATRHGIPGRAARVALVVGTVLNIINQYDGIFGDAEFHLIRAALTYCVPYCVASFAAVQTHRHLQAGS